MRLPLRDVPWPAGPHEKTLCPVCGLPWIPWVGSYLPCHARCLFTEREQDKILDDDRTEMEIAKAMGVTISVIRSARRTARERRGL